MNSNSNMSATIEQIKKSVRGSCSRYLVRDQAGRILGQLEKFPNTRTEQYPWKAFLGAGNSVKYLGAYYPEDGGKKRALQDIENFGPAHACLELRVVAVSSTQNSFGLTGIILMARDGRAWEVGHNQNLYPWIKGMTVFLPADLNGNLNSAGHAELQRELPKAPQAIVNEVWK